MDSPLIWAGSKRWLVPALQTVLDHNGIVFDGRPGSARLVELFAGGASVAMGIEPVDCLLNDTNKHLINFWRFVSQGKMDGKVYAADDAQFYNDIRDYFNAEYPVGIGHAERFYALNHWCFNGLYRENRSGVFNVPKRKRTVALPPIPDYRNLMANWTFTCQSYRQVILLPTDVVFADPPYDDGFTGYTSGGFGWHDQQTLAEMLALHQGPVIATNKATARIQELYADAGFRVELREGTQRMHHSRGRSDQNLEMIATKGLTVDVSW
jgi:DNA adenine methylase